MDFVDVTVKRLSMSSRVTKGHNCSDWPENLYWSRREKVIKMMGILGMV